MIIFFLTTMAESSFLTFYLLYSIGFAIPQGLTYMAPVHHAWLFFPNSAGLVSGLILGGYGFGSLIFDNLSTALINPYDDPVDEHDWYPSRVNENFKKMMYMLILSWAICIVIGLIMIFEGPIKKKRNSLRAFSLDETEENG